LHGQSENENPDLGGAMVDNVSMSPGLAYEVAVRDAAEAWLTGCREQGVEWFTRDDCFPIPGGTMRLMAAQQGIWKPRQLEGALSVSTVFTPLGQQRPYDDSIGKDGLGRYKWRGTNPDHSENRALRFAMKNELRLIWFQGFAPGLYAALFPVYLIGEEPSNHQFVVAVDQLQNRFRPDSVYHPTEIQIRYTEVQTRQRLHQAPFRAAVMNAYGCSCAVCSLRHSPLLDAAHIIPDSEGGKPIVQNALSLCKIHHAAYDSGIIGITPDLQIEVNSEVLHEKDGPMLQHGIQEFHGSQLMVVPKRPSLRPDPEALENRYRHFMSA
jgi:putative restriction endonuclease